MEEGALVASIFGALELGFVLSKSVMFPEKAQNIIGNLSTVAIFLLLFIMGITIGADPEVMADLGSLGLKAFLIAAAAVTGSILAVWAGTALVRRVARD